jgi:hypothetical protein
MLASRAPAPSDGAFAIPSATHPLPGRQKAEHDSSQSSLLGAILDTFAKSLRRTGDGIKVELSNRAETSAKLTDSRKIQETLRLYSVQLMMFM